MKAKDLVEAIGLFDKYMLDGDDLQVSTGGHSEFSDPNITITLWCKNSGRYIRGDELCDDDRNRLSALGFMGRDICWAYSPSMQLNSRTRVIDTLPKGEE